MSLDSYDVTHIVSNDEGNIFMCNLLFDPQQARDFFSELKNHLHWRTESIRMFNKVVTCPRLIDWYGEKGCDYVYSGNSHVANGWNDVLLAIKKKVESVLAVRFNFVLCNYYRDGADYVGWHDDGEDSLESNAVIASVSFGQTRRFEIRYKRSKVTTAFDLHPGSLLVMSGPTQRHWKHRLPKDKHCRQGRINLTFRRVKP